jgi:hypothetical protein
VQGAVNVAKLAIRDEKGDDMFKAVTRLARRATLKRTLDNDWRLFRHYMWMGHAIAAETKEALPPRVQDSWKEDSQWVYDYLYAVYGREKMTLWEKAVYERPDLRPELAAFMATARPVDDPAFEAMFGTDVEPWGSAYYC